MRPLVLLQPFVLALFTVTAIAQSGSSRTITGVITDSECFDGNHNRMRMGDTDAECAKACIEMHDGSYMLFDGTTTWTLSDQKRAAALAAQKVVVSGTVDAAKKTITVDSIVPAK